MKRPILALLIAALAVRGAWIETKSGPYFVLSDAGDDAARTALTQLEQFRWVFGDAIGKPDLKAVWPITVVVGRPGRTQLQPGAVALPQPLLGFSRDGWLLVWPAGSAPSAALFRQLALLFLDDNLSGRMPGDLEGALASLFSTLEFKGGRYTLGIAPPQAERTRSWAMFHYLLLSPDTAVRTRALMANLAAGADEGGAYRNAFGQEKKAIEAAVEKYLAAGTFPTVAQAGRPLDPDRQFAVRDALPSRTRLLGGDVLMAQGAPAAQIRAAYEAALNERPGPGGQEGLALVLIAEKASAEAKKLLEAMAADENAGARGLYELARIETDRDKSRALYERASKANPRWVEPYVALAGTEPGPVRKAYWLKKATELAPRNPDVWRALAEAQFDAKQFADAEKSWRAAERVARNEKEQEQLTQAREKFQEARYDAEAAERRRRQQEERDEVDRLRKESLDRIKAAEQAANQKQGAVSSKEKMEKWWEGPPLTTFQGTLERVECQGSRARLTARGSDGKPLVFLVPDAGKVLILGPGEGGQVQLSCGIQKPARRVKIEYAAKPDAKSATAGEAVTIEFQ